MYHYYRVNGSSYPLSADSLVEGIDYTYSLSIEADDESRADFVLGKDSQLTLSTLDHKDDTKFSAAVKDVDIVGDLVVNFIKGIN